MKKGKEMEDTKAKIKPKNCPKCGKIMVPQVDVRYKTDKKHERMTELTDIPFFKHMDVWYKCGCGYECHQTYHDGKLISETK